VGNAVTLDGVAERFDHGVLPDQLGEGLRPVFARQYTVSAALRGRRNLGKVETQSRLLGRIGVVGGISHCHLI